MFDKNSKNKYIYECAFIGNPNRKYSFPLDKMIMSGEMDFYRFIENGKKYDANGAFLVITEQQYIIGINAWDGAGSHNYSHARVNLELKNRHPETLTLLQIAQEALELEENFIVIDFENETSERNQRIKEIRVSLPRNTITPLELKTFENFYYEYNEAIRNEEFIISCRIKNSEEKYKWILLNDIDDLLLFMKNNTNENLIVHKIQNEEIIGIPNSSHTKTM